MNANSKTKDFYGRDFIITKDVLIPRPETEQIIDAVLNLAGIAYLPGVKPSTRVLPKNPIILDVGTGSGCIAITLLKEMPNATIYASDISEKALNIARRNAEKHEVAPIFITSNLLDNIHFTPDVIVANLPYVDKDWDWLDKESLKNEPEIALYADDHGLELIKKLIDEATTRKVKFLLLESDTSEHEDVKKYAEKRNYDLLEERGFIQVYTYR